MNFDYEKLFNINTSGIDEASEDFHHNRYEPTPYKVLERILDCKYITKDNTLIDMGCGKGRVSIFLHHYIGCKVIGIDFSEDYIQAANENKHAYNAHADIKFVCQKAEEYTFTNEDCFYFFNPFSEEILRSVIDAIIYSYYENNRPIKLFFYYPEDSALAYLMGKEELICIDEIECQDLYETYDERESVFIFEIY